MVRAVNTKWFPTLFMVPLESKTPNIQQVALGMAATITSNSTPSCKGSWGSLLLKRGHKQLILSFVNNIHGFFCKTKRNSGKVVYVSKGVASKWQRLNVVSIREMILCSETQQLQPWSSPLDSETEPGHAAATLPCSGLGPGV